MSDLFGRDVESDAERRKRKQKEARQRYNASEHGRAKNKERNKLHGARRCPIKRAAYNKKWRDANPDRVKANRQRANRKQVEKGYFLEYYHRRPAHNLVRAAKNRAKMKGQQFDLTYEWADKTYNGFCSVTGIQIQIKHGRPGLFAPSLDRIDSFKGYTQDNCRWVLWGLNRFKGDGTEEDMLIIARALIARHDN